MHDEYPQTCNLREIGGGSYQNQQSTTTSRGRQPFVAVRKRRTVKAGTLVRGATKAQLAWAKAPLLTCKMGGFTTQKGLFRHAKRPILLY